MDKLKSEFNNRNFKIDVFSIIQQYLLKYTLDIWCQNNQTYYRQDYLCLKQSVVLSHITHILHAVKI